MKCIFDETTDAGIWETAEVRERPYGAGYLVEHFSHQVRASVVAHYDKATRVLVVDCTAAAGLYHDTMKLWWAPAQRVLETVDSLPAAQRRAITVADAWYQRVIDSTPVPEDLTEEEIISRAIADDSFIRYVCDW